MKNYGQLLKICRKSHKINQTTLAKACNITQQAISNYENNLNQPTIEICEGIADFYGISIDELVGHDIKKNW